VVSLTLAVAEISAVAEKKRGTGFSTFSGTTMIRSCCAERKVVRAMRIRKRVFM
jgi:hypothetical protein